jgi:hypothetical protein
MVVQLTSETQTQLRRYVKGDLSNAELADWLAGAEYDNELPQSERDELARVSLVLIEIQEGRRERAQLLNAVAELLASTTSGQPVIAVRSGSDTAWSSEPTLTAAPARLQRVGI